MVWASGCICKNTLNMKEHVMIDIFYTLSYFYFPLSFHVWRGNINKACEVTNGGCHSLEKRSSYVGIFVP